MIVSAALILCLAVAPEATGYHLEPVPRTPAELAKRFTPAQIELLEMLNRRDRAHLLRAEPPVPGLVVPDTWTDDPLAYGPFPHSWPAASAHAKVIVVHQAMQAFGAYEQGTLVRWGPVSTGRKETPTPDGAFNLTWRARSRRSTDNQDWLLEWYFNFVNERGVSFHLFDLPGYPASHSCVRMLRRDAEWLYDWGVQWSLDDSHRVVMMPGTPVLIVGAYPFGAPAAWLSLDAISSPVALPDTIESGGRSSLNEEQIARGRSLFSEDEPLVSRVRSPVSHRGWRCARLARRDDRAYREYVREEQRRQAGCSASRMQQDF